MKDNNINYKDYLGLEKVLNAQNTISSSHDETLFIIVHQVFELWFKQIIHEIDSIIKYFKMDSIPDKEFLKINSRINRVEKILSTFTSYIDILETMSSLDFLEFRDMLGSASGFQSIQFRELEIKLGLTSKDRPDIENKFFNKMLQKQQIEHLNNLEKQESLIKLIEKWLNRMPFTKDNNFNFLEEYKKSIDMFAQENNLPEDNKNILYKVFDEKYHKDNGKLSKSAKLNALFIFLYRNEPILSSPYQFLISLMNFEEVFSIWRHRHAMMAHRMLGTKIGTGGSSGYHYLNKVANERKFFQDLFEITTFIIPEKFIPTLPDNIKNKLNFFFK